MQSIEFLSLLAQDAEPQAPNFFSLLLPLAIVFILYILIVQRPQQRERQQRSNRLNELKKGDQVVTIGGLFGKVESVDREEKRVTISVDKNTNLTFLISAVDQVIPKGEKGVKKEEKK